MEPLRSDEVDCKSIQDAVQNGHYSCLQHLCAASTGCKLSCNTENSTPLDLIEHRSDGSCTALLQLLISVSEPEDLNAAAHHATIEKHKDLLSACVFKTCEVELCYSCLHALLDAGVGNSEYEIECFTRDKLFRSSR